MKKIIVMTLASLLMAGTASVAQPQNADQKWLAAVEKMVANGKTEVTTPHETRVQLLKEWAAQRGYSVEVTKGQTSYRIELSKKLAQK